MNSFSMTKSQDDGKKNYNDSITVKIKLGQMWISFSVLSGGVTFHVDCQDYITDL